MNPRSGYGYGSSMHGYPLKHMREKQRTFNCAALCFCLVVPSFLYGIVSGLRSFSVHYDSPALGNVLTWTAFACVLVLGYSAFKSTRRRARGEENPSWSIPLFISCFVAWMAAYAVGSYNFTINMQPYYDVTNLNVYPSVDPAHYKGQQIMDAGRVIFTADSYLDLRRSIGFKNLDIYCVAPIASGTGSMAAYDFWAVGKNCCSGHAPDFACGEFNNPMAHSGLRLMHDEDRPFFRLAVQQAEASYNIKARHPVFLQWMQDPVSEINAYQNDGFKTYLHGVFGFVALNTAYVVILAMVFSTE